MTSHHIEGVRATVDAVSSMEWDVKVRADFYGGDPSRYFLARWVGHVAFDRERLPSNMTPAPTHPRMRLGATWTNIHDTSKCRAGQELELQFRTDLPGDALDRIERFRDGGRLFARLEGRLLCLVVEQGDRRELAIDRLDSAIRESMTAPRYELRSEPFELTRDLWQEDVLAKLRPAGRHVVEVTIPTAETEAAAGVRLLGHIQEAQQAFDTGRHAELARVLYRTFEELEHLSALVEARHGEFMKERLREQLKALRGICNPDRHGEQRRGPTGSVDRPLAEHLLISARSLAAVFLRS